MITWAGYCADCEKWEMHNPYKDEADFNRAFGISDGTQPPLVLAPKKDSRKAAASLDNFIKIAESSKRRRSVVHIQEALPKKILAERPPREELTEEQRREMAREKYKTKAQENLAKGLTARGTKRTPRPVTVGEEALKKRRCEWTRLKRIEWKAAGLTSRGKPFKAKGEKPEPTSEETKAKRKEYARTYRTKNREKHLAYRREYRKKQNEAKNNTCILQEAS